MRMGFKYQILSCSSADQLVQVTLNHLQTVKHIVNANEATALIEEAVLLTANVSVAPFNEHLHFIHD